MFLSNTISLYPSKTANTVASPVQDTVMSLDRQQLFLFSFLPLLSAQMRLPFEIAPAPTFSNLSAPFEIPVARAFYSIKLSAHPWPSSKVQTA